MLETTNRLRPSVVTSIADRVRALHKTTSTQIVLKLSKEFILSESCDARVEADDSLIVRRPWKTIADREHLSGVRHTDVVNDSREPLLTGVPMVHGYHVKSVGKKL